MRPEANGEGERWGGQDTAGISIPPASAWLSYHTGLLVGGKGNESKSFALHGQPFQREAISADGIEDKSAHYRLHTMVFRET